jgi:hypothetical protein
MHAGAIKQMTLHRSKQITNKHQTNILKSWRTRLSVSVAINNKWREQMMELAALAMLGVFAFAATMSVLAVLD